MTRTLTLSDLGLAGHVSLSNSNFEQHFYFPAPQGVALKDAHFEIHGTYLHPFVGAAALTLLVNGRAEFAHRLPDNEGNYFFSEKGANGSTFTYRRLEGQGDEIDISLPQQELQGQGGFVDLGLVLSSQTDATHCIDERGRGNELSIDPKATQLRYSFDGASVQDIRSLLGTLPHRPVILLPRRQLTAKQYDAALRLSLALSEKGLQPEFIALPQVGDVVDTASLPNAASVKIPEAMADAIARRQPYKIAQPVEIAVWLALRMMSPDGLAQVVIDPEPTRQALLAALPGIGADDNGPGNQLWLESGLSEAGNWLAKATLGNANVRISMLAGQPVLALEGENMAGGVGLIASTWRQIAGSSELLLNQALHMSDKDSKQPHIHFASNLPVQNVAGSAEWVTPIQLNRLPDGKWPDSLELNLMAAPSGDGLSPVVSVFMNDNLLTALSLRTDGEITRLRARIPLYALRMNNLLRVEIRRRNTGGHCSGTMQSFPVQLLPSSLLNLRDAAKGAQFFMLGTKFDRNSEVAVPARYLLDSLNTLPVVAAVLRGLAVGETDFSLIADAKPGFKPSYTFAAFESAPDSETQLVTAGSGRLVVRNRYSHTVFDSAGLGNLAVIQLIDSGKQQGVNVTTVNGVLPALRAPLELSAGDLAIADAGGVRLAINLDSPRATGSWTNRIAV